MSNNMQSLKITGKRLEVEIAYPGTFYSGSRFDWTGFITKVTLDGKHSFCAPESPIPGEGSGGFGFCNEFGIHTPIGYDEAIPGEKFHKLGTGLLTRPDESNYFFFDKYEVAPFPVTIESASDHVIFELESLECKGYAVRMIKEVSVDQNKMIIKYNLKNVGSKPIQTEEYCHNFISIDNNPTGPDYVLRFPYSAEAEETPDVLDVSGNEIRWNKQPNNDFYIVPGGLKPVENHFWELLHEPSGVGVREISTFPIQKVAVWGKGHVISPEVFININIEPGKTQSWERVYEFFTK
ncbi:hypothetical protein [Acetivibrio cellulolyticus]|uniref:hypothetical protein n=1 Tax=Acetivibrio cellulolyticus TaxID=35830 RepID=UPI0001E2EB58|nr:hypothetical protein [Acetivibrio cellulolyticus]